jgi:hypothetical protein
MRGFLSWSTISWSIFCIALSAIVLLELWHDYLPVSSASVVVAASSESRSQSNPLEYHPPFRELIRTITARPLFSPSRHPYVPSQGNDASEIDIKLLCVLSTESGRTALVRLKTDERLVRVHERDFVSDWQVERISADRLYLRRNSHVRIVSLWAVSSGQTSEKVMPDA